MSAKPWPCWRYRPRATRRCGRTRGRGRPGLAWCSGRSHAALEGVGREAVVDGRTLHADALALHARRRRLQRRALLRDEPARRAVVLAGERDAALALLGDRHRGDDRPDRTLRACSARIMPSNSCCTIKTSAPVGARRRLLTCRYRSRPDLYPARMGRNGCPLSTDLRRRALPKSSSRAATPGVKGRRKQWHCWSTKMKLTLLAAQPAGIRRCRKPAFSITALAQSMWIGNPDDLPQEDPRRAGRRARRLRCAPLSSARPPTRPCPAPATPPRPRSRRARRWCARPSRS